MVQLGDRWPALGFGLPPSKTSHRSHCYDEKRCSSHLVCKGAARGPALAERVPPGRGSSLQTRVLFFLCSGSGERASENEQLINSP